MIQFKLKCADHHEFEAWFRDGATYDAQSKAGEIECPMCGNRSVTKAPMAPRAIRSAGDRGGAEDRAREVASQILQAVGKLREEVEKSSDYVGEEFAEEARRIHYGEKDQRNIYGEATAEETKELDDEGIEYSTIPWFPRKNN
ncbi:MAG: DUF1178 family protein [Rhodospirillales bacterium]|jgi:hypothetical protein|nr:DUF1178 family protein [Rhodospirillales bacterium]MDP7652715.1 DUF1178 family protein [Rhodospirillales bacterium]HJO97203.1 DUF1178 family protein [Rhodospirillales bacterium]